VSTFFIPGKVSKEFQTKTGKSATIRNPDWTDLSKLLTYINELSQEDTFIRLAGEEITRKHEIEYLASVFSKMELKDAVYQYACVGDELVGTCEVHKMPELRSRGEHAAGFGLSIAQKYRGEGIGYELSKITIEEATKRIPGLKIIILDCFSSNTPALKLYEKLGFKVVGRVPKMLYRQGKYDDQVQMSLEL
jgi:RimJ/RimL family protein N-acetyltransferase